MVKCVLEMTFERVVLGGIPIIEDLTAHDMTSNAPAVFIPLATEPVVTQHLGVEIMRLE